MVPAGRAEPDVWGYGFAIASYAPSRFNHDALERLDVVVLPLRPQASPAATRPSSS